MHLTTINATVIDITMNMCVIGFAITLTIVIVIVTVSVLLLIASNDTNSTINHGNDLITIAIDMMMVTVIFQSTCP